MKGQATINGKDIWVSYKANLIKGAYKELSKDLSAKDNVKNTSRLEDGDRFSVSATGQKFKSRDFSISFLIQGDNYEDMTANYANFIDAVSLNLVNFGVKRLANVYKIIFNEIQDITEYRKECMRVVKIKFTEPNPKDREHL